MNASSRKIRGFSLVELIVVIMIIGIIAAFTLPAASTVLRGSQLTQASQTITDQFSLARQTALTRNRAVEVRLIRYVDPEVPNDTGSDGQPGAFRAIQTMVVLQPGSDFVPNPAEPTKEILVPIDKPQLLPQSVIMSSDVTFSTLVAHTSVTKVSKADVQSDKTAPKLPRNIETNYEYTAFRFQPDGSTNLPATGTVWFVTLQNMNDHPTGNTPPANFFTLQVDPVSGKTKQYRPSV